MYTLDRSGRPRLNGKLVKLDTIPKKRTFETPAGPCVVVARNMEERIELANATKPEDLEGFKEALASIRE